MTSHENDREPGYYWVNLKGEWYIGKWRSHIVEYGVNDLLVVVMGTGAWTIDNDKHIYNDLELDAILPTRLTMDKYERMYGQQLAYFNDKQKEFLFGYDYTFTQEEQIQMFKAFQNKKDGKDSRNP
jgi:hypothetical protein